MHLTGVDNFFCFHVVYFVLFFFFFFFFFFSSRRRHTRSKRDWSSDVCSSDLCAEMRKWRWRYITVSGCSRGVASRSWRTCLALRSEERRVGKECRSRWSPYDEKKKKEIKIMQKEKIMKRRSMRIEVE